MFGGTDGWFDDPIELSARAYILVPPIALGKSLLARHNFIPRIKPLSDPRACVLSSHWCQEHGIFRTFSLFIFTTFCLVLPPHTLFTQFHTSRKDETRAIDPIT